MQDAHAMHCFLASLRQSATEHEPEAPSSTHQGRGAGPAPHCISKLLCLHFSIHAKKQLTLIEHKLSIPLQLTLSKSGGSAARWNGRWQTAKSPERALPDPRPSKGMNKSIIVKLASTGAVPRA
eukprot:1160406-Pelagomonas_calceolata.AAC.8